MAQNLTYQDIIEADLPLCPHCDAILANDGGFVEISGIDTVSNFKPRMWRHSERDVYHAWVYIAGRHIILCGTPEFDERTLKRIKPLKVNENQSWHIFIDGETFTILDHGKGGYEILHDDGTIVKNEVIEAKVFNYMMTVHALS